MYSAAVKGVVAFADAEKSGALLEGFGTQPLHLQQLVAVVEGSVAVAVVYNRPEPQATLIGDVNDDGAVDIKDVTILKQYLAKWKVTLR